jgi:hypothetical protein
MDASFTLENGKTRKDDKNDDYDDYDVKHMTLLPPVETNPKKHEYLVMLESSYDTMRTTKQDHVGKKMLHHEREQSFTSLDASDVEKITKIKIAIEKTGSRLKDYENEEAKQTETSKFLNVKL